MGLEKQHGFRNTDIAAIPEVAGIEDLRLLLAARTPEPRCSLTLSGLIVDGIRCFLPRGISLSREAGTAATLPRNV